MKMLCKVVFTVVLIFCLSDFLIGQNMERPILIKAGDKVIDAKPAYTAPCLLDFDNDGVRDLIVGTYFGNFRFYKNLGTNGNPKYNDFSLIKADGKEAKIPNW